jgi:hypothetical protein
MEHSASEDQVFTSRLQPGLVILMDHLASEDTRNLNVYRFSLQDFNQVYVILMDHPGNKVGGVFIFWTKYL